MLCSRPDFSISISILSRYQKCASYELWQALKRVLRYIQGTLNYSLIFKCRDSFNEANCIVGFCDSDWAGDGVDRKSTSGYVFKLFGCTISWTSRKQSTVALSSTESEYIALSFAVSEACWLKHLLIDLKLFKNVPCVTLYEDNQSAIKITKNPEYHKRLKHVDIKFHFIREKVKEEVIKIKYISTKNQLPDVFTKPLAPTVFNVFCSQLGLGC